MNLEIIRDYFNNPNQTLRAIGAKYGVTYMTVSGHITMFFKLSKEEKEKILNIK